MFARRELRSQGHDNVALACPFASRIVVSTMNTSQNEGKFVYVELNIQTPCPPRGAVPVNQGMTWETVSLCSLQIDFGHGCDHPNYVREPLTAQRSSVDGIPPGIGVKIF
jgi:hypothetical protein